MTTPDAIPDMFSQEIFARLAKVGDTLLNYCRQEAHYLRMLPRDCRGTWLEEPIAKARAALAPRDDASLGYFEASFQFLSRSGAGILRTYEPGPDGPPSCTAMVPLSGADANQLIVVTTTIPSLPAAWSSDAALPILLIDFYPAAPRQVGAR